MHSPGARRRSLAVGRRLVMSTFWRGWGRWHCRRRRGHAIGRRQVQPSSLVVQDRGRCLHRRARAGQPQERVVFRRMPGRGRVGGVDSRTTGAGRGGGHVGSLCRCSPPGSAPSCTSAISRSGTTRHRRELVSVREVGGCPHTKLAAILRRIRPLSPPTPTTSASSAATSVVSSSLPARESTLARSRDLQCRRRSASRSILTFGRAATGAPAGLMSWLSAPADQSGPIVRLARAGRARQPDEPRGQGRTAVPPARAGRFPFSAPDARGGAGQVERHFSPLPAV